jgi:hypothetical protein
MPSTNPAVPLIKTTNSNLGKGKTVFDAVVIANYGDPGLDEDYHADILSRYVVCVLESANRNLTYDRWKAGMIVIVKRPEQLWIDYDGGFLNIPTSQKRIDASLNTNVGTAGAYSVDAIPRINSPYQMGEKIKIKLVDNQDIFSSQCSFAINQPLYGTWHTQGAANLTYASNVSNTLRQKTLTSVGTYTYNFLFNKLQYEAFALSLYNSPALKKLFQGTSTDTYYYKGNGGYYFNGRSVTENLNIVQYEDMNVGGKMRLPGNSCIPLVVTTPNSFTVPRQRAIGTVSYLPTYIPKT